MQFSEIPGHQKLKDQLVSSVLKNRIGHALLFLGAEGNGALPLALALSQYLNCTGEKISDSCGTCNSCTKAKKYIHPDIHFTFPVVRKKPTKPPLSSDYISEWREMLSINPYMNMNLWMQHINAENKQGNITVDECREIIKTLSLKAFEGNYKIYLIWKAETLKAAANVLLKIIEEPPPKTVFILIAENQDELLPTVLSRTHIIKVPSFSIDDIENALIDKHSIDAASARKIAKIADGNYNAAIQMTAKEDHENDRKLMEWFDICVRMAKGNDKYDIKNLYAWSEGIAKIGRENQKNFLKYATFYLRECIMLQTFGASKLEGDEHNFALKFIKHIDLEKIEKMYSLFNNAHYFIERNANPRILFFNYGIQIEKILQGKKIEMSLI